MNCEHSTSEDRKNHIKVSQTKQMRQEFEQFVENTQSSSRSIASFVSEIKESLNIKSQVFVDLDQLASAFDALSRRSSGKHCMNWTESETSYLVSIVAHYCNFTGRSYQALTETDWQTLEKIFPTKTAIKLQKRWSTILAGASVSAEKKSSKTCNVRFLQKGVESSWSLEEELRMTTAFLAVGKEWTTIANSLGNRTENDVKNHIKTLVKKLAVQNMSLTSNLSQNDDAFVTQLLREFVEKANAQKTATKQAVIRVEQQNPKRNFDCDTTTTAAESVCEEDIPRADSLFYQRAPCFNNAPNGFHYVPNIYNKSMYNQWAIQNYSAYLAMNSALSAQSSGNFFVRSQQPGVQSSDLNTAHVFKIASGKDAREEFSKEVTKAGSKVFFAMVNFQDQQIQLLDKVSEATFPKYC